MQITSENPNPVKRDRFERQNGREKRTRSEYAAQ